MPPMQGILIMKGLRVPSKGLRVHLKGLRVLLKGRNHQAIGFGVKFLQLYKDYIFYTEHNFFRPLLKTAGLSCSKKTSCCHPPS